jgi:type I restriction enzyme R subunit
MNVDNFIVRPKRKYVETYAKAEAWEKLGLEQQHELTEHVAGLPSAFEDENEEAKRFDLLMFRLQLAVLRAEPEFSRLRDQVRQIAEALEDQSSIPMIQAQLPLIQELQTDKYWEAITAPMLNVVRKRLRDLVKLIEKEKRKIVYTDFEDELGTLTYIDLPGVAVGMDFEKFIAKARHFLRVHENHVMIYKLRQNQPLTTTDLEELERMLGEVAGDDDENLSKARQRGLGLFVRSLVGLERDAAKEAFAGFLTDRNLTANQIEFVNLIIDHLTEHGAMEPERLYESPFTDLNPQGIEGMFKEAEVTELLKVLEDVRATAA